MKDYQQFDAHDFMHDPSFRDWVAGRADASAFWEGWLRTHPEKNETVQQAREWLLAIWTEFDDLPEAERVDRVARIKLARAARFRQPVVRRLGGWRGWAAAAAIVLVCGLGWLAYNQLQPTDTGRSQRISYEQVLDHIGDAKPVEQQNPARQPRRIALPDGSVVTLSPNSKISYEPTLAQQKNRTVYLSGEAFFEVVKDPARPFQVYAHGIVTKVLGTSFRIKAYDNVPDVTVQVRTGRVSVFASTRAKNAASLFTNLVDGIILTPNQQVVLTPEETLVKSIVPKPVLLNPDVVHAGTVYTDVPLSQILQKLEDSYGIEIVYDEIALRECLLTARLYDEPLLEQISLLCKSVGATYAVTDGRIVLTGGGCQ
ncbi:FecR family protein [Spirosoma montaniterrae]|uniref:Iron dicitrate transport regulator FecR n=1 Tax=Spirosoma montaniterrae TaxID=1178516 RepID=A0A1P9WVC4_9BACT|nr:FecR family protein [Spirosoma montaniterrae]AQG79280.1 hypothetical protein AWR27_08040 [Spirosoma montaniterrae]